MPTSCSAYNCKKRKVPGCKLSFYRFPFRNKELLARWVIAMKFENWQPTRNSCLCQLHFEEKCFRYNNERRSLVENAVPTIFNFPKHLMKKTKSRPPPKNRTSVEVPQLKKVRNGNYVNGIEMAATVRYTPTRDHEYAFKCPVMVKKMLLEKRDDYAKLHKLLRATEQRLRRQIDKCASLKKTMSYLRSEMHEKDKLIRNLLSRNPPD